MRNLLRYAVVCAMLAVAVIGLPIFFPYNLRPHADKSEHAKSALMVNA